MTAAAAADAAVAKEPGPLSRWWRRLGTRKRRRTPSVLQIEALECGAASLAIVLAHFGRRVPLEELRVACGVTRDGSKASNVLKAARRYGLVAKGFRREVAELADMPIPSIIHWNFNHFLVFEGFGRDRAFLNDPAEGRRTVTIGEFGECFTGVVLAFERGPDFKRGGKAPSLAKALSSYLRNTHAATLYLAIASIALFVPGVVIPALTRIFVDDVLIAAFTEWLPPLLIGMAAAALLRAGLVWLQQGCLIRLEQRLAIGMGARSLWHVLQLPPRFFDQRYVGDVADRVAAAERIARLLSGQLATNLLGIVALVFYAAVMAVYDPLLTGVGVGIGLLNFLALSAFARGRAALNRGLLIDQGKLRGTSVDIIRSIESIKTAGLEQGSFARWAGYHSKVLSGQQGLAVLDGLSGVMPSLLAALSAAAILGLGGWRVMNGAMTVGTLVAFQSLMASFTAPIARLVELAGFLQQIKADLERTDDVMRFPRDPRYEQQELALATEPARLSGAITLRDVSFGFSPFEAPLIEDFSLTLTPGMRVALVGASGSGKSTLGRIVAGLYQPSAGEVLFDGIPLLAVPRTLFASSVAYVDQDIFLFEGTVRDNLTLWDATIPEEDLAAALKDAVIHEEVATRAGRYDCPVAEGGTNFSGGQRQRLEIARALVGSPSILILDEATSALDPMTEQQIDENIRRRGCTCVIVAHRLSTIRDCDEIIVLDKGKVVGRGRHEALLAEGGVYARLIQSE